MKKDTMLDFLIASSDPDIITGAETWLNAQMATSEFLSNSLDFAGNMKNRMIDSHGAVLLPAKRELTLNKHTQRWVFGIH